MFRLCTISNITETLKASVLLVQVLISYWILHHCLKQGLEIKSAYVDLDASFTSADIQTYIWAN